MSSSRDRVPAPAPRYYRFGRRDRYYIDSTGYVSEHDSDPEVEPQHGEVPRFVAEELLRLRDLYVDAATIERNRIRTELIDWLIGRLDPKDAGLINGRRITTEIDRICPLD